MILVGYHYHQENMQKYNFNTTQVNIHKKRVKECFESEFYQRVAKMIPNTIDVDTLVLAFKIAFNDAKEQKEDYSSFISLVPQYIRKFASLEFAHEFRIKFSEEVLGLTLEKLPDVDYGITEIEEGVIDISNKDKMEVLAALYNASIPIGMGFYQYNPMPWTKEIASVYFQKYAQLDENKKVSIKWILGRPINCQFINDLIYVAGYNNYNESNLAQRVIATCPNVNKKKLEK